MCVFSRLLRTPDKGKKKKNRRKVLSFVQSRYHCCNGTKTRSREGQRYSSRSTQWSTRWRNDRDARGERASNCVGIFFILKIARSSVLPITSNRWNSVRFWCPLNIIDIHIHVRVHDRTIATQDVNGVWVCSRKCQFWQRYKAIYYQTKFFLAIKKTAKEI